MEGDGESGRWECVELFMLIRGGCIIFALSLMVSEI